MYIRYSLMPSQDKNKNTVEVFELVYCCKTHTKSF